MASSSARRNNLLARYTAKRHFNRTPEPAGAEKLKPGMRYSIQKHAATTLHYDLRLELDGVLKSWAITKGPSLDPSEKRLSVRTEDHPLAYAHFEGSIPDGNYGAGTVLLWDRGIWQPLEDPHEGLRNGKLVFELHGERLKGQWALVRFRGKKTEKRENWLLIKQDDAAADPGVDVTEAYETSVASDHDIAEIEKAPEAVWSGTAETPGKAGRKKPAMARKTGNQPQPAPIPEHKDMNAAPSEEIDTIAGVRLSHLDRVLYAEQGLTKRDLARYLEKMAEPLLAHAANRLMSLVRCPRGSEEKCFFQRHGGAGIEEGFKRLSVRQKSGTSEDYLYLTGKTGLITAAQMGALEFHIWGLHVDDIERPDRLVFDLDPSEELDFSEVKQAALFMRDVLDALGLESFPLLTGGKGIHVVAPLVRQHEWPVIKNFTGAVARRLAEEDPDRFVAVMSKAKRKGRIFIDYLRNERGSSAIAPFSPRARPGAPLAWPVDWNDFDAIERADQYRLADADPASATAWANYAGVRQRLKKSSLDALGIDHG